MRNVLIYKLNKQTQPVLKLLSKNKDISFYIAITREDFYRTTYRIKPEIIFLSNQERITKPGLQKILMNNPQTVIYRICSKDEKSNPVLEDLRSDIKVKFVELLS